MSKNIEKLKNDLTEIAEVVNSFQSEAVQLKVIDKLLDDVLGLQNLPTVKDRGQLSSAQSRKAVGSTKAVARLLTTDFFEQPHSIAEIAEACAQETGLDFTTAEISGVLIKLMKNSKLTREVSAETNRYIYSKTV